MDKFPPDPDPIHVGFLLVPGFSMLCVASIINPFRSANRDLGREKYRWSFLSSDDAPAQASDGIVVSPSIKMREASEFDYFFVVAGLDVDPPARGLLNTHLHRLAGRSKIFGALCTGSFILARAGFLDGYRFTLHWENQPAFAEEFPELEISQNLYVLDRDRWTGSGGFSSMDVALTIIASHSGEGVANAVGNQYQIDRIRSQSIGQRPFALNQYATLPDAVQTAVGLMMENMEDPLQIPVIADATGKTVRSLERLFARHLGASPARFYRKLRLERVRQLLWHTNLSILEIALMTGFPSPSHLSRLYQAEFGMRPSDDRKDRNALAP
ncbi:MAG: GlxA family transcriptional regulator [Pseudomonadota bacterium]